MRKEYNNRHDAPLVYPAIRYNECVAQHEAKSDDDIKLIEQFEKMLADKDAETDTYWQAIRERSENNARAKA